MALNLALVALGGALGAALRYLAALAAARAFGAGFPWGTLAVNVAGSLAMGLAAALLLERSGAGRGALFAMTGLLGGFTTYSAYSLDFVALVEQGRLALAGAYAFGTLALAVAALALGLWLGRMAGSA